MPPRSLTLNDAASAKDHDSRFDAVAGLFGCAVELVDFNETMRRDVSATKPCAKSNC